MNDEVMNEEIDDRGQWFVVQTLSGHENKVCESVKRLIAETDNIYEAAIPQEILSEVKNGQRVTRKHNVFPGYIFVRMDLYNEDGTVDESAWYSVRNVQSVIGFLGGTNHPAPLSKQEIVSIFRNNNTNEQEAKPKISFEIGETESPIIPLYVRDAEKTFIVTKMAFEEGVFINPVIPPACAPQDTLLRFALMATHTKEQVDMAVEKLTKCFKALDIIK